MTSYYSFSLTQPEEKIAQMLTRDAWVYFSSMISQRDLFHIKEIPMMPRGGSFEVVNDAEIIQYYLDFAASYSEELGILGWDESAIEQVVGSFVAKIESATGISRGMGMAQMVNH